MKNVSYDDDLSITFSSESCFSSLIFVYDLSYPYKLISIISNSIASSKIITTNSFFIPQENNNYLSCNNDFVYKNVLITNHFMNNSTTIVQQ